MRCLYIYVFLLGIINFKDKNIVFPLSENYSTDILPLTICKVLDLLTPLSEVEANGIEGSNLWFEFKRGREYINIY